MSKSNKRKNPPLTEKDRERAFILKTARWAIFEKLVSKLIWATAIVLGIYFGVYKSIAISKGQETTINFLVGWIADFRLNVILPWAATAGFYVWAKTERRKRLKERKERDTRIIELEKQFDPARTSSNLTTDGRFQKKGK